MYRYAMLTSAALLVVVLMGTSQAQGATSYNVMYRSTPTSNWAVYTQAGSQASANATAAGLTQQGFLTEIIPLGEAASVPVASGSTYYAAPGAAWLGGYYGRPGYWGRYGYAHGHYGYAGTHYGYAGSHYGYAGNHYAGYHHNTVARGGHANHGAHSAGHAGHHGGAHHGGGHRR